ncbi:hypothetical protein FRC12_016444 [Ceratobasidium sp. 428]|nr:hypothetical protein FRC12_016444 [Ceratobasidium sp. 428]
MSPKGSNPYAYAAEFVATIIPRKPDWYFANIIAAGIVAAVNLISTIGCFFIMWKRSRAGTGVGLWFFRTRRTSGSTTLLIILQAFNSPGKYIHVTPNLLLIDGYSRMYFWYGFVFIWDATGMWTSAFGTLYATLLPKLFTVTPSDQSKFKTILLHPITLNALCFLPPIGLALTQFVTSTFSAIAWSDLVHTQFGLIDLLTQLAGQWSASGGKRVQQNLVSQAGEMGTLFLVQKGRSQTAFQRNAWTCGSWYLLCIILFTPTAVWLLWTIRGAITQRVRRPTPQVPPVTPLSAALPIQQPQPRAFSEASPRASGFPPFSRGHPIVSPSLGTPFSKIQDGSSPAWSSATGTGGVQQDDMVRQLRRALYTATLQFIATFFCLGFAAGSWIWIAADAGRIIVNSTLHALGILLTIWVYVIVGCLVNLFILIRTRREDDGSASGGNAVPLSAIKASHASSHPQTQSRADSERERDRKPMFIVAHTTTHVVVDDDPRHKSIGSDAGVEVGLESAYSLSSSPDESARDGGVGNGEKWSGP